jgi:hypothetical protein
MVPGENRGRCKKREILDIMRLPTFQVFPERFLNITTSERYDQESILDVALLLDRCR